MVDHRIRAERLDRQVVEAEADRHAGQAGCPRGANVKRGIADEGRVPSAAAANHFVQEIGGGLCLARAERIAAEDRGKARREAELLEQADSEVFKLVGDDGDLHAVCIQRIEHRRPAREVPRVYGDVIAIVGNEIAVERGDFGIGKGAAGDCEGAFEHHPRAAADEIAHLCGRHGRAAGECQGMVERHPQIARRIEQGAIEIEADDAEGKGCGGHGRGDGGPQWNPQAFAGKESAMTAESNAAAVSHPPLAVVILAAGKGTRMKSDLHKVLHPVAGRPMLEHLLDSVGRLAPERQVVVVGSGREQLERQLAGRAELALQEPQHGTGHAVQMAEEALAGFSGDVLILYGDVPFVSTATMQAMLDRLHAGDAPAVVVLAFEPEDALQYGRVIAQDGRIEKMVEHKDATEAERACSLCNSGLMAVRGQDLFTLLARVGNDNAQGEYYLVDIVNIANADGRHCAVVVTADADEVAGINSRGELAEAEARWQGARRRRAMAEGASLVAPETVWFAWDTDLGRDVTIEPNVVFGPGVRVADGVTIRAFCHLEGASVASGAEIGPYARLRPGAVLEKKVKIGNFVEVKAARMGEGAKANHLSYIGDAEVGPGANIGAGTITCNYDGYFKHKTVIGPRAFIGSNSALVAPVKIGADAIVAAGSAVTRDVADGELRLVRAEQLVKPGWADRFHDAMKRKKAELKK